MSPPRRSFIGLPNTRRLSRCRICNGRTVFTQIVKGHTGLLAGTMKAVRCQLRGCAQGRATQAAYFPGLPPKTPKMTTSGPNPGSRAQNLGLGQMRSFLSVLEGFKPNVTTSGPNPWFWAQNHGFGPDVVIFSLTPPGASQKPS